VAEGVTVFVLVAVAVGVTPTGVFVAVEVAVGVTPTGVFVAVEVAVGVTPTGVFVAVGDGTGVFVFVAVGSGGSFGSPGKVRAKISWMFVPPVPSELRLSMAVKLCPLR
jgi:hypothetical protein